MKRLLLLLTLACTTAAARDEGRPRLSARTMQYLAQLPSPAVKEPQLPRYVYRQDAAGRWYICALLRVAPGFSAQVLESMGVHIGTRAGDVWTAQVPLERVQQLTEVKGLRYVQLDEPVAMNMDSVRKATQVDKVHDGTGLPHGFSGKDVVVGILDAGFDYTHPSLYDTSGAAYRVRRVWEQRGTGTPPAGFAYGSEITDTLQMAIKGTDLLFSHGAHVAGIAAGSGFGGSGDNRRFRGIAYASDLVLVGITPLPGQWTSTGMTDIIDGMSYVYSYAASVNKPAVANLSWGCSIGSHDGLSLFSQACDNLGGPGKIFVLSAGNNGDNRIHLKKTFSAGNTEVRTSVVFPASFPEKRTWVDAWGEQGQSFCARLVLYNGSAPIDSSAMLCLSNNTQQVQLIGSDGDTCFATVTAIASDFNSKPHILVDLYSKTNDKLCLSLSGQTGTVNAWMGFVDQVTGYYGSFSTNGIPGTVNGDIQMTVGDMATTQSGIAVGAYASKTVFTNVNGGVVNYNSYVTRGNVVPFSSRGPRVDGTTVPDITGPGMVVGSAVSSYDPEFFSVGGSSYGAVVANYLHPVTNRNYSYAMLSGTSMSSPAVSGIVALLLEADKNLTPAQVMNILATTAIQDNFTGTISAAGSPTWGFGKVNAWAALQKVLDPSGVRHNLGNGLGALLYPNPADGRFSLELQSTRRDLLQLTLSDVTGRVVYREQWQVDNGSNLRHYDWRSLGKGLYLLQLGNGSRQSAIKVVIE